MSPCCLVSIYGPSNVLAAMCAVKHYSQLRYGQAYSQIVTLIHNPGMSGEEMAAASETVEQIIASQGWPKPITITAAEMDSIIGTNQRSYSEILRRFQRHIAFEQVDDVFFGHNVIGYASDLAMHLYPSAGHITFGDAMGNVTSRGDYLGEKDHSRGRQPLQLKAKIFIKQLLRVRHSVSTQNIPACNPNAAVLILPLDFFGNYLTDIDLSIVPREVVLGVIASCQQTLSDLVAYSHGLLETEADEPFLLLIGNLTDASKTLFEDEVMMYEDMVREHVPVGSTVFIKAHPLAVAPVADALVAQLGADFKACSISHRFARYPIELWRDLVQGCKVMSFSYSAISLRYVYNKPVVYPMDEILIKTYFRAEAQEFFRKTDSIYRGVLANLATWDGQSVLWKGFPS